MLNRIRLARFATSLTCCVTSLLLPAQVNGGAVFRGLGVNTYVYEVAGNGSKVVGASGNLGNPVAGYWSEQSGWVTMNWGNPGTVAYAVSGDGSVITGYSPGGGDISTNKAYRWTAATGAIVLPAPANQGLDISADGTTIVGAWKLSDPFSSQHPYRNTSNGGTVDMSSATGMPSNGSARGVSGNGNLITGFSTKGGWLWNAFDNSVNTLKTASTDIGPWSMSANGTTIVGDVTINGKAGAGYWRSNEGIVMLLPLNGGDTSARDVTADGKIITEYYYPDGNQHAWIWDVDHGVRKVEDVLSQDYGLAIGNWRLRTAFISDDGKTMAGFGLNPNGQDEAWVATVPEPSTLALAAFGALGLLIAARRRR